MSSSPSSRIDQKQLAKMAFKQRDVWLGLQDEKTNCPLKEEILKDLFLLNGWQINVNLHAFETQKPDRHYDDNQFDIMNDSQIEHTVKKILTLSGAKTDEFHTTWHEIREATDGKMATGAIYIPPALEGEHPITAARFLLKYKIPVSGSQKPGLLQN